LSPDQKVVHNLFSGVVPWSILGSHIALPVPHGHAGQGIVNYW